MPALRSLFLLLMFSSASIAEGGITLGYVTGNSYLKLSESERTSWVIGTMDGIMAESALTTKDLKGPWFGRCIQGLPVSQIKAMFEQELQSHPDSWHAPAAFAFRDRFITFCQSRM